MPGRIGTINKKMFSGAIILLGIGIFLLAVPLQDFRIARRIRSWPAVQGVIRSSEIVQVPISANRKGNCRYTSLAVVKYNYSVEGQDFIGSRISFGNDSRRIRNANAITAAYPVGKKVFVYYDPEIPIHSVLQRKIGIGSIGAILIGFPLVLSGIGLLITSLSGRFQKNKPVYQERENESN